MYKTTITVYMTQAMTGCATRAAFDALVTDLPARIAQRIAGETTVSIVEAARAPGAAVDVDYPTVAVYATGPDEDGDGEYRLSWSDEDDIRRAVWNVIDGVEPEPCSGELRDEF